MNKVFLTVGGLVIFVALVFTGYHNFHFQATVNEGSAKSSHDFPDNISSQVTEYTNEPQTSSSGFIYDLDGNGINDSNLLVGSCAIGSGACLKISSTVVGKDKEINLGVGINSCRPIRIVGDHTGNGVSEIALESCTQPATLLVIDPLSNIVVRTSVPASFTAYSNYPNYYIDYPKDKEGKLYPFLANGYSDTGAWGYLCLYRPDLQSSSECGNGFVKIDTVPSGPMFREEGGYLQDLDGDGWEDINLIFHGKILTVSPKTLTKVVQTDFDVAIATEPNSPIGFHSGRLYGTHSAVTGTDKNLRNVMVGGLPVKQSFYQPSFLDPYCNVGRFVAVLESEPGQPSSRVLKWSKYFGFHSNTFTQINSDLASNPPISRQADMMNGCIHRFSDSRSSVGAENVIVINHFIQSQPIDLCVNEQYQLYLEPPWTNPKQVTWDNCIRKNLKAPGDWATQVIREKDGSIVSDIRGRYIWGWTSSIDSSRQPLYFVEKLPSGVPFDLSSQAAPILELQALTSSGWTTKGTLPFAGRPKIIIAAAEGSKGVGSPTGFAELKLRDLDGDGLKEFQMANGRWVGYSAANNSFVEKTDLISDLKCNKTDDCAVPAGSSVTLSWTSNGTYCSVHGPWVGGTSYARAGQGSESSGPLTQTTKFTIQCGDNEGASAYADSVTVQIVTPTPTQTVEPVQTTLRVNGGIISTKRQLETFEFNGNGFTPVSRVVYQLLFLARATTQQYILTSDRDGFINWKFIPTCSTKPGTYTVWAIDQNTNRKSNNVTAVIKPNPSCSKE